MERGQVVFPARDCADVPFLFLKFNTYSNRFMSRATSPLLYCSQLPFDNKPLSNHYLHSASSSVQ